jgi:hypothetical protein
MPPTTLEERVAQLERRVDELSQGASTAVQTQKDWRRTVGMFRGDAVMKEVIDHALQAREAERTAFREQQRNEQP